MPGRKLIHPPPASLSLRFYSAARAALSASCVTGFRLAARQGECTSTPPPPLRWEEIWCRFYHFAWLAWCGSGAAFSPPRLPASNPERSSAAPTATGAQPAPLFRGCLGQGGGPKGAKAVRDKLPRASRKPCAILALLFRPPVLPAARRAGALPELPRRHGPPRRTALQ